jgi:hypothetical protein
MEEEREEWQGRDLILSLQYMSEREIKNQSLMKIDRKEREKNYMEGWFDHTIFFCEF